jgi:hypothetical protein
MAWEFKPHLDAVAKQNCPGHDLDTWRWHITLLGLECPALFVPVEVRETGMKGAFDGTREKEYAGADCESASSG